MPKKQDPKQDATTIEEVDLTSIDAPVDELFDVVIDLKKPLKKKSEFENEEHDEILSEAGLTTSFGVPDPDFEEFEEEFEEEFDEEDGEEGEE